MTNFFKKIDPEENKDRRLAAFLRLNELPLDDMENGDTLFVSFDLVGYDDPVDFRRDLNLLIKERKHKYQVIRTDETFDLYVIMRERFIEPVKETKERVLKVSGKKPLGQRILRMVKDDGTTLGALSRMCKPATNREVQDALHGLVEAGELIFTETTHKFNKGRILRYHRAKG